MAVVSDSLLHFGIVYSKSTWFFFSLLFFRLRYINSQLMRSRNLSLYCFLCIACDERRSSKWWASFCRCFLFARLFPLLIAETVVVYFAVNVDNFYHLIVIVIKCLYKKKPVENKHFLLFLQIRWRIVFIQNENESRRWNLLVIV